jgi:hypothetical protein
MISKDLNQFKKKEKKKKNTTSFVRKYLSEKNTNADL